jgi:hypothetical protein
VGEWFRTLRSIAVPLKRRGTFTQQRHIPGLLYPEIQAVLTVLRTFLANNVANSERSVVFAAKSKHKMAFLYILYSTKQEILSNSFKDSQGLNFQTDTNDLLVMCSCFQLIRST